jgi:hypothetical protein
MQASTRIGMLIPKVLSKMLQRTLEINIGSQFKQTAKKTYSSRAPFKILPTPMKSTFWCNQTRAATTTMHLIMINSCLRFMHARPSKTVRSSLLPFQPNRQPNLS